MSIELTILAPFQLGILLIVLGVFVAMIVVWVYKFIKSLIPGLGD